MEAVAFNADGIVLATAGIDGTAKLWDVFADDACLRFGPLVTAAEPEAAIGGSEPVACTELRL